MLQTSDEEENTISDTPELSIGDEPTAQSLLPPLNPPAGQRSSGANTAVSMPVTSSVALSRRATDLRRRAQLRGLVQQVPQTLPVRPSTVLKSNRHYGKSIALPATKLTGRAYNSLLF